MGRTKNMGVVNVRKKKTLKRKMLTQNIKTSQNKKRFNKKVTLTRAHKWKDDSQISWKGALTENKGNWKA